VGTFYGIGLKSVIRRFRRLRRFEELVVWWFAGWKIVGDWMIGLVWRVWSGECHGQACRVALGVEVGCYG